MAPALTETTTTGQSQKFALTMSPPLPGIDKIALNHTRSVANYLHGNDGKHSKTNKNNNNNNNNNNGEICADSIPRQQEQTRRRENGRESAVCVGRQQPLGPSFAQLSRKRPAAAGGGGSGSVIFKYEVGCKQGPTVFNGKAGNVKTVEDDKCTNSKPQSYTMNGKTPAIDEEEKRVNKDLETKTMGTLKANSSTGHVLNSSAESNGSKDLEDTLSAIKEEIETRHSSAIIDGKNSSEVPVRPNSSSHKIDSTSGGPGPPSPSKQTSSSPQISGPSHSSSCHRAVTDKIDVRLRFQANLEKRANYLLRRIYKLQTNHAAHHVSRQMMEFVGVQRKSLNMSARNERTSLLRLKLISSSSSVPSSSTLLDMKERILQSEDVKNMSTAALVDLVRKLECGTEMGSGTNFAGSARQLLQQQSSSLATNCLRKYGVSKSNAVSVASGALDAAAVSLKLDPKVCDDMEWASGNLLTNLRHLENAVDSDATASSSGGESCDEMDEFEEKRSKFIPFYKRAAWKWAVDRAGVISRWTWLQAQVSDLEYKIRQTGEIYRQLRVMKEPVVDEKSAAGSSGNSVDESSQVNGFVSGARLQQDGGGSSRTCPLRTIRKRKLLKTADLPQISRKAARLCNIHCSCTGFSRICNICCGRVNHVQPMNVDNLDLQERMGHLDPSFHPVLSFKKDIPLAYHFEAILSGGDQGRFGGKQRKSRSTSQINDHARKQCRKLKKNATATLTGQNRFRKKINNKRVANRRRTAGHSRLRKSLNSKDDRQRNASESSGLSSKAGSPVPSPGGIENSSSQASGNSCGWSGDKDKKGNMFHELMRRKRGESAFDIDNIVIPYSMAASTRVERLQYKEIITPKWRIVEDEQIDPSSVKEENGGDEDVSEETCIKRHDKCEQHEKKRFMNYKIHPLTGRRSRSMRSDSRADSSGANTPDPLSPHNMIEHHDFPLVTQPPTPAPAAPSSFVSGEETHLSGIAGGGGSGSSARRRTTSLSKRDRMNDDFRVPTPDFFVEPVAPWDTRTFPLTDETYEIMVQESVVHEPTVPDAVENRTDESGEPTCKPPPPEWNESPTPLEQPPDVAAIPPESCDDPDWVPTTKTLEGDNKTTLRHSIVLKLAKR